MLQEVGRHVAPALAVMFNVPLSQEKSPLPTKGSTVSLAVKAEPEFTVKAEVAVNSQSLTPSFHVNLVSLATLQAEGTQVAPGPAVVESVPLLQANGAVPVPGAVESVAVKLEPWPMDVAEGAV